LGWLVARRA
jgi:hypothetical protein